MTTKQLTIKNVPGYEGKEYTLEYNRRAVQELEKRGFRPTELDDMPVTQIPLLVEGAFFMHHRNIKSDEIDAVYASIKNKSGFLKALSEMYSAPVLALVDDPEDDEGNASWETNW